MSHPGSICRCDVTYLLSHSVSLFPVLWLHVVTRCPCFPLRPQLEMFPVWRHKQLRNWRAHACVCACMCVCVCACVLVVPRGWFRWPHIHSCLFIRKVENGLELMSHRWQLRKRDLLLKTDEWNGSLFSCHKDYHILSFFSCTIFFMTCFLFIPTPHHGRETCCELRGVFRVLHVWFVLWLLLHVCIISCCLLSSSIRFYAVVREPKHCDYTTMTWRLPTTFMP